MRQIRSASMLPKWLAQGVGVMYPMVVQCSRVLQRQSQAQLGQTVGLTSAPQTGTTTVVLEGMF